MVVFFRFPGIAIEMTPLTAAKETPHGDCKNCDWSALAACVFRTFLMPAETVDS